MSSENVSILGVQTPPQNSSNDIRVKELQRNQMLSRIVSDKRNPSQFDLMNLHQLEVKLTMVERLWESFEKIQMQLEILDESQFDQPHRNNFEDAYFAVKSYLLQRMANMRSNIGQSENVLSSTHIYQQPAHSSRINLPTLQLTKFNGNRREWLDFYNMFCVLVHNNSDLSPIAKFQYLRSCLMESAAKLIQSLEVTEANYEKALNLLISRYENKYEIFQSHVMHLFHIQKIKQPNISNLRDFIDNINADLRALESIATKSQIADGIILQMFVSKLDAETQSKWEEEYSTNLVRNSSPSVLKLPTWENLAEFLERRCKTLNIMNDNSTAQHHSTTHPMIQKYRSPSTLISTNRSSQCIICKSTPGHNIFRCPKFIEMDFNDRLASTKQHKLCLNCLGFNHIASSCPSQNRCRYCNSAHHSLLHKTTPISYQENPNYSRLELNNSQSTDQPNQNTTLHSGNETSFVLLATAIVELCNEQGVSIKARALLDSCSQLNFITKRMSQFLKPPSKKINLKISGLGNNSVSAHHTCSVIVKSPTTAFVSPIDVVIIPCISSNHPQQQVDISKWQIPSNITLADKNFNHPGPVDLLIGADFFWDLLMVGRIKIQNQPNFIKTKLGWVVSGSAGTCNSPPILSPKANLPTISVIAKNIKALNSQQHFTIDSVRSSTSQEKARAINLNKTHQSPLPKTLLNSLESSSPNGLLSQSNNSLTAVASQHKYNSGLQKEETDQSLLEKFWLIEECPLKEKEKLSEEEVQCENYFYNTTKRCPKSNKFIVRLPFKDEPTTLGQSLEIARRRYFCVERKLRLNKDLGTDYIKFMEEYCNLNHMSPVLSMQEIKYFIPHHCVVKPDSSTTRLRVVFDASCRTTSGRSLNDILCVGPKLQDDIFHMLIRFRYHKYVLVADIAKMYRQVLVHDDDTKWQGILWRKNLMSPLIAYKLQTLTYGTSSAPYLAIKCLQQLAYENADLYPIGAKVTLSDFYVDNLMTGGKDEDEVFEIKQQVVNLLKCGGFPLRKFASNSEYILSNIPDEDKEDIVELDNMQYIKTLGLRWSPKEDSFSFSYTPQDKWLKTTKRSILSHMSAFFDPLGLINPIIVKAKILLQSLWILKLHWDESVPQDIFTEWEQIRFELNSLNNIRIPRFVDFNSLTDIHVFSDASKKAFGACIYAVTRSQGGIKSSLICAKSRVAPVKEISLPRLELCAVLLGAKLLQSVRSCFPNLPKNIFGWTDSTIALAWITGESRGRPTFVANRITKIKQISGDVKWQHVPTEDNPADLLSRGTTATGLTSTTIWFNGPCFLRDKSKFPIQRQCYDNLETPMNMDTSLVVQMSQSLTTPTKDFLENHKFINSYEKLLRIMAYVLRFISRCKCSRKCTGPIASEEMYASLISCCKIIQRSYFAEEFKQLSEGRILENKTLQQLSPFLKDDLIRVGGRIRNSPLPFSAKHPILLPGKHLFVKTLITHYHKKNFHAGNLALHNILREHFWILNARNIIKQIIHSCVLCYRYRPKTEQQIMGALPVDRVQPAFPFQICGIDYCGPFLITNRIRGRSPIKGYISLFVCFSTKAIHMELVPDLTTKAFILALKRFISRRGRCSIIYSDNATNFIGANKELRALLENFLSEDHNSAVNEACTEEGITWKFIPPRSPHFGGLWESAVKQAKFYLRRAIGNYILTYDELHTIICQTEAILNSRPLTPLSSDPNDLRPLTPAHFLIGRPLATLAEPDITIIKPATLRSYKLIQWIQQHFWSRWHKEYLNCLQQKTKWTERQHNIKINDLVLLKEDNTPPLKWSLARVVDVSPGEDGVVRVATVKTIDGIFKRSITKLCKLPLEN